MCDNPNEKKKHTQIDKNKYFLKYLNIKIKNIGNIK